MSGEHVAGDQSRSAGTGHEHAAHHQVGVGDLLADHVLRARHHGDPSLEDVIEPAQPLEVQV